MEPITRAYDTVEQAETAIADHEMNLVPTVPGPLRITCTSATCGAVRAAALLFEQPISMRLRPAADRFCLAFSLAANGAPLVDGRRIGPRHVLFYGPGAPVFVRPSPGTLWSIVSLPRDCAPPALLDARAATKEPGWIADGQPSQEALDRLSRCVETLLFGARASHGPALETELASAAEACARDAVLAMPDGAWRRLRITLDRFAQLLQIPGDERLTAQVICTKTGVAPRTLRHYCEEALGMGPVRFVRRHRLRLARQALLAGSSTVTDVALANGFNEFGRFSREYARLFGELPSGTLRRRTRGHARIEGVPLAPPNLGERRSGAAISA